MPAVSGSRPCRSRRRRCCAASMPCAPRSKPPNNFISNPRESPMIKVMSLIKRKEGMSLDAYRTWALEEHPKLARNIPGMKRYQVDVMVKDDPANPFDSVSEMWFDSEE